MGYHFEIWNFKYFFVYPVPQAYPEYYPVEQAPSYVDGGYEEGGYGGDMGGYGGGGGGDMGGYGGGGGGDMGGYSGGY